MDQTDPGKQPLRENMGNFRSFIRGIRKLDRRRIMMFLAIMGPGMITANADNDAGGIRHTPSRGPVRIQPSLAILPITFNPGRRAGDERPDGRGDGQGACRPYPGAYGVRLTCFNDAPDRRELGLHYRGVRGGGGGDGDFRDKQILSVPLAAAFVWFIVVKGNLQARRARFPHILLALFHICNLRATGAPALA